MCLFSSLTIDHSARGRIHATHPDGVRDRDQTCPSQRPRPPRPRRSARSHSRNERNQRLLSSLRAHNLASRWYAGNGSRSPLHGTCRVWLRFGRCLPSFSPLCATNVSRKYIRTRWTRSTSNDISWKPFFGYAISLSTTTNAMGILTFVYRMLIATI